MRSQSNEVKNDNMIVHVFMGNRYHHVPSMIKNILSNSKKEHFFILYFRNEDQDNGSRYRELFKTLNHPYYQIAVVPELGAIVRGTSRLGISDVCRDSIHYALFKNRKRPIVFHGEYAFRRGDSLIYFFLSPLFRSIAWVCWGFVPGRNPLSGSGWKEKLTGLFNRMIMRKELARFDRIVCLLGGDQNELMARYTLNNTVVIPYIDDTPSYADPDAINTVSNQMPCRVLLGNSATDVGNYMEVVDMLAGFSSKVTLRAMLNYGKPPQEDYDLFISKASEVFGGNFFPWTELVEKTKYIECLKMQDIYICNTETQTGLGAIYFSMLLGKKLYLNGYNYEWIKNNGFKIFHVKDIYGLDYDNFVKPLSIEDRIYNLNKLEDLLNIKQVASKWESLYDDLLVSRNGNHM